MNRLQSFSPSSLMILVFGVGLIMFLNFLPQKISFLNGAQYGYPIAFYQTFRSDRTYYDYNLSAEQRAQMEQVLGDDIHYFASDTTGFGGIEATRYDFNGNRFWIDRIGWNALIWIALLSVLLLLNALVQKTIARKKSEG